MVSKPGPEGLRTELFAELEALVGSYRDLREQRRHVTEASREGRRLTGSLEEAVDRFEALLEKLRVEEASRVEWRGHLYHGAPSPDATAVLEPIASSPERGVEFPIEIVLRGPVGQDERSLLHESLLRLAKGSPRPPLHVRGSLTLTANHSQHGSSDAKAAFDLGGHIVHAHATAPTPAEAVDRLADRLKRALHGLAERNGAARRHGEEPRP